MSKQASKTVIGLFVVGAIALVVIAIVILGSGKFFKKTFKAVCYFEGSVGGLNIGAPVVLRGVRVGSVTDVIISADPSTLLFTIPVYIEIEPDKVFVTGTRPKKVGEHYKALIDRGLRATLQTQSIVTGQMQVGLDFYPDKPAKFVAADPKTPEIPTIPTPLQELAKKIQNLPIDEIVEKVQSILDGIDKVVQSPELKETIRSVNLALGDVRKLVKNVDGQVGPLASNVNETLKDVKEALKDVRGLVKNADAKVTELTSNLDGAVTDVRGLVKNVDSRIGPLTASIEGTLKSVDDTLIVAQNAMEKIEGTVGEDAVLVYELNKTLEEMQGLARSIRILAEHLERRPETLIRGK
jgi:paraquat-inducible protein B